MKKYLWIFLIILFMPFIVKADEYHDVVAPIAKIDASDQLTIYFFHGSGCPHCANETIFLDELKEKYGEKIQIVKYEVWYNSTNDNLYSKVKEYFDINVRGVPFTVIGEKYFSGFSTYTETDIKRAVDDYLEYVLDESKPQNEEKENVRTLPIFGEVNIKSVSIPIIAMILGLLDGFNPCAMWILLFLINMLFNMQNRKRMWVLGITFLFTSALAYFFAMLGLNVVLSFTAVNWIRTLIGAVALIGGVINIRSYIKTKNEGCHIVDDKKRNKYFTKIKKFTSNQSFILSIIGIIALAFSVNMVELACTAVFPALFVEILNINNLTAIQDVLYILLYVWFFLLDDLIVFIIAMTTLKLTGISTKYNRFSHLVGGVLMIVIGILLILVPEWLMFNFKNKTYCFVLKTML